VDLAALLVVLGRERADLGLGLRFHEAHRSLLSLIGGTGWMG
jgi:hypothetical protein